jgi:acetoacetyl-CoA reductase
MGVQRTAVVAEATGIVGEAICRRLASEGYKVVAIHAPQHARPDRLHDAGIDAYAVDLSDYKACETGVLKIVNDLGRIDILVNNSAVMHEAAFHALSPEEWGEMRRTNLDSVFNMSRPVLHGMLENGWGRIVNLSSIVAQQGAVGQPGYAAMKAAVHGFTKALALEVASKGITVNTVSPGYLDTGENMPGNSNATDILQQIPVGRLGKPEEVAALVAYLCSDDAGFLTGAQIAVNGGQYMF